MGVTKNSIIYLYGSTDNDARPIKVHAENLGEFSGGHIGSGATAAK